MFYRDRARFVSSWRARLADLRAAANDYMTYDSTILWRRSSAPRALAVTLLLAALASTFGCCYPHGGLFTGWFRNRDCHSSESKLGADAHAKPQMLSADEYAAGPRPRFHPVPTRPVFLPAGVQEPTPELLPTPMPHRPRPSAPPSDTSQPPAETPAQSPTPSQSNDRVADQRDSH